MGCRCDTVCGLIVGSVVGALVAVFGAILMPVGDNIIASTVNKEAVLEPGTTAYENFASAGNPVYRQFWLYDVLNAAGVVELGETPEVKERGPYTYRTRYLPKENITAHENHTVSFLLPAGAIFEPSMSVGPEEDEVTVLNLGVAGAYSSLDHGLLNLLMQSTNSSLFQRRSVKEVLWGYRDPLLLSSLVGIFYPYNGTFDGPYSIFTGKDDISKVSLIDKWNDQSTLSFWDNPYCDMINGTDASSFPPFLDKKEPLFFFSSDICRSVSAVYSGSHDLMGIDVYRYKLPPRTLTSPVENPDNMCFCRDELVTRNCTLAGVLDVSSCRGFPVYISLPHFLHGSAYLTQAVHGLSPSEEHHFTYLDVEPTTGFTLRFAKRLQVNMMYGPSTKITALQHVKDYTIFPVVWLNETAAVDEETADMFKKELVSRIDLLDNLQIGLMSVGSAMCVLCAVAACVVKRGRKRNIIA
ncbi:platelet glycoprotein 4 [Alosa pseudoharengus]|uniref:platelet glycoprotein 4 n=1 Tax=Alosa pseudoharengus TaxID=34774 RepID=UPI003F8B8548